MFCFFSAGEVTRPRASLVPSSGAGAPVKGNLWKAHTHRSGHGGSMLENSGLVLGVDSSFGLLTRLHNPRHVGVALLVHGRLLHLRDGDGKGLETGCVIWHVWMQVDVTVGLGGTTTFFHSGGAVFITQFHAYKVSESSRMVESMRWRMWRFRESCRSRTDAQSEDFTLDRWIPKCKLLFLQWTCLQAVLLLLSPLNMLP